MKKIKRLLALILIAVLTVTQLPVPALASNMAHKSDNMPGFSSNSYSIAGSDDLGTLYNADQKMVLASISEAGGSGLQYALSLKIELNELECSLSVEADTYTLGSDASGGKLVVTLYENENGIPKLLDLFTAEVPDGILENTPNTAEASGVLSYTDADPEKLVVSAVICRSLDEPLPLSAAASYDADGFILVPVSVSTLAATEVTKTSGVLHGQVAAETGNNLNAADYGFLFLNSLDSEAEEEIDDDGYPVGVILPDAIPAVSITPDGQFSLPLTNLEPGQEYQYMAVSMGKVAAYGEPMGFTTKSDFPEVSTNDSPTIDSVYSTATLKGTITDSKGFAITESGVMYGSDPKANPVEKTPNQSGLEGNITSYLGSLEPGETYYYRAYAKNSAGIGYGKTYSFNVPAVLPSIKSTSASFDPVTWKATFSAEIESDGGSEILDQGFRYKKSSEIEWSYLPVEIISGKKDFTLELEGQNQLPIGAYTVEAYLKNSEGMVTKASGGISTDYLSEVDASLDKSSITVSSAILKGNITAVDYRGCQKRGFEYKAVSENLWIEAGMETGKFGIGEYTFTLEGLQPYTDYEFRAKAYTYAGWSFSPEISFTTVFSNSAKETAYQMKMDGKSANEIAGLLNDNLGQTIQQTSTSLKFAGFNAAEIAQALKAVPYIATYGQVAEALKDSGFDASAVANALKTKYADVFAYEGGNLDKNVISVLIEQGYTVDEMIKTLRDFFKINIVNIPSSLNITTEDVCASLIRLYGAYDFAHDYWTEYNAISNPSWYIGKLTEILKNNTDFSAGDIAAVLKEVYPEITAVQFITNCREFYPAVSDMGDAVIQAFGADPLTAAKEMNKYSDVYSINDIKNWLIHKHGLDAPQMVKIMMELTNPVNTVPSLLKDDFSITSATDAARVMYDAGWKEDENGKYGYWRVLKLLKDDFSCTASDLINIMKELGLSPLAVAQQMEAMKTGTHISSWIPEYKAQGYTASDLAAWCKTNTYGTDADQTVIVLKRDAGYTLDEITSALKQVYELDANGALTILKYGTFTNTYSWWTDEQATAAVDLAYNTNTLDTVVTQMKAGGATPEQIANTLKESFNVANPIEVAEYLILLGYEKGDVLSALAQSFRTLKNAELIQMLSRVLREKYSDGPMENIELILSLYENVKGSLNNEVNAVILLHNSGFTLLEITHVLQDGIEALQNVTQPLTALEAGKLLLGLKAYGLTYERLDVFDAVEKVYGVNFMQETVIDYKNKKEYSVETIIGLLSTEFGVDTPSAAALCLKAAGYSMTEVLKGLADSYSSKKDIFKIEMLRQVMKDVYPEEQAPMRTVMAAMLREEPGLAAETLHFAGYSMKEIINILHDEYELSSGEVTQLLYDRNFENIVVSVEDIYSGNGYLDFILYRKGQGDSITQLFNWLDKKLGVKDITQIVNTLKLAGFTSEDVITFLYEKRKVSDDETILQVQDVFGEDSIQNYISHRKSQGDTISQVFTWLQKFGIKEIEQITDYLYSAGYTSNELIEFFFSIDAQGQIKVETETVFGENTIVAFLKDKKASGERINEIYFWLNNRFTITNITQISNYLKAVSYTSNEIMEHLFHEFRSEPTRYGEIVAAIQAANGGTDTISEFLIEKKKQGDTILVLYDWLKDKFSITDMTQTVSYLKAVGYTSSEIMEFLYQKTDPSIYGEIVAAVQAANGGTDTISEFLIEKKKQGDTILVLYDWLKDKFSITDMTQTVAYLKAVGYTSSEIMEFLYQKTEDSSLYGEIVAAIQAANGGTDTISEFLIEKKKQGDTILVLYDWLKDKFSITDMTQTVAYLKAVGYTSSEIMEFLYQKTDPSLYGEIVSAVQAANAANGTDVILGFLCEKKDAGENLNQLHDWLTNKLNITGRDQIISYLKAIGYTDNEIITFWNERYGGEQSELEEIVQAIQAASDTDVVLVFLREKKTLGEGLSLLYGWLKDKFGISDINKVSSYFLALDYSSSEVIDFLYQQISDPSRYEEIIAAVQAAQASSGADAILEFLRYKKSNGEGISLLYGWLKDKFGISDINKVSSYFLALDYSSSEVIDFLYQKIDPGRYEEIVAAVQATQASSGADAILEFLRYKKSNGEGLSLLYGWLKDKFGISDINKVSSYFLALDYSSNEVIDFLYQQISDPSRYEEIVAAVQTAQASSGADAILEFLRYKKSKGEGLDLLYIWLTDKFGISDINKVSSYFLALDYSSNEVIDFLYQQISDPERYEEIVAAVQAAQASSGADAILEFLRYKKSNDEDLIQLYQWLTDKFGISDINKVSSYFLALDYSNNEVIDFLYQQISDPERYEEIVAAVQAAQASSGADAILEFMRYKKSNGEGLYLLYQWLSDKFGIMDISKILYYLRETGFSSEEVIEFAYSGQVNLNEQLISSLQNNYGDDSIIDLLTYRKSQGDGLAELSNLLSQLNITETGQVAAYFQMAGFSVAQVAEFFNQRGINQHNQIIALIQSVYGGNTIVDFLVSMKNNGDSANICLKELTNKFGIKDLAQIPQYLKDASYTDSEIVAALDSLGNSQAIATLKALYPDETPSQIVTRLLATSFAAGYSVHQLVCCLKQEFPTLKYSETILIIRDAGRDLDSIINWLLLVNINETYKSLGLSKSDMDDLVSILGSHDQNDLKLERKYFSYILADFGYTLEEAIKWAEYGNYSSYDVFKILRGYRIGVVGVSNRDELLAMQKAGYSLEQLAEAIVELLREGKHSSDYGDPYLRENPYSTASHGIMQLAVLEKSIPEITAALIYAGISPRYMINALWSYWYDRYYLEELMPHHYPHQESEFTPQNYVQWIYDAVEKLPEEKKSTINTVEEAAAGFYSIRERIGASNSDIFDAMMYVSGQLSVDWREKIPQTDVDAIDDLINLIVSFISFPGQSVNNILDRVLVVNALRTAGYNNDEATDLLKDVVGSKFIMNFVMQAMGGYNAIDSWKAVMRVDAYRVQVTGNILWTIACNAYRLDTCYKIIKDVKKNYDRLKKICIFLIDHGVLGTAPAGMTLAVNGGFSERMIFAANRWFSDEMLLQSYGAFSEVFAFADNDELPKTMSFSSTSAEISDVTLASEENSTITVRGTVSSGADTELLILMKKPGENGESQKDTQLNSLSDVELKEIIDYFGYTVSTETVGAEGTSHNFELQYHSSGISGKYTVQVGTADATAAYVAQAGLFLKSLAGKVSITGTPKIGETLTADISELTNAASTLTYQWYRADHPIDGANSNTYTLVTEDNGKTITVKVTADETNATGSVISAATKEVTGVYTVSIGVTTGGTITASPATATEGESITLTITPDTGKRVKAESLKYNDGTEDHFISGTSFTMPAANITVTAEFEDIPPVSNTISVLANPVEGGVVIGGGVYAEGEHAELIAIPNPGFTFVEWTDNENLSVIEAVYSFTMGTSDIHLVAEFEVIPPTTYSVNIDSSVDGGVITASPATATEGETITLTITPDTGKQLKAGSLIYNDSTEDHSIGGNTFAMPAANVTVTAEFEDVSKPVTDYDKVMADIAALSIGYAPGDSAAAVTQNLNLTVTGAVYGSNITWITTQPSVISKSGVVTRPGFSSGDAAVTLSATANRNGASSTKDFNLVVLRFPQITYTVTFEKNGGDNEANPVTTEVIADGNVGMLPTAPTRAGYTFKGWNMQTDGRGTNFTAATTVTGSITVYAQWSINSSDEGGGSSDGSGDTSGDSGGTPGGGRDTSDDSGDTPGSGGNTSTPVETLKNKTTFHENTVTSTTTVTAVEDNSGNATAMVSHEQVSDAIVKAMEEAEKQGEGTATRVEIKVEASANATTAEAIIPKEALNEASNAGINALTISNPVASITLDANTLSSLSEEATGDIKISASKVEASSLSSEVQKKIGDRPVFDFTVSSGDKTISQFEGDVLVSLPYTLKDGEDSNAIVIYFINDSGELEVVHDCIYDPATGTVSFRTRHFSKYAVGYNKVNFRDVAENEWYGKAVGFIAAREITSGTGDGNFSPEAKLTRSEFIVMMMRAYGIAPDTDLKDNFDDAADTWYTGYLAAAKRLSISNGVGSNMFAPDKEITRHEMFTLLYNALKVIGRLPEGKADNTLSDFADAQNIASWAKEAMKLLVETGIINGNGGKLSPTSTTTRAEMAQVLYNLLSRYRLNH